MTPTAGIRIGIQQRILGEEVIIRIGDELHHPDELAVVKMDEVTLRHVAMHTLGRVLHSEWERHRGGSHHDIRR